VGLLQPIVVRQIGSGQYELVMGERRWRATREAGLPTIPDNDPAQSGPRGIAIRFHLAPNELVISSQNAEEGEANETIQTDYTGDEVNIGFNAQYLQDFLNVVGDGPVAFEFKDANSQAQLRPAEGGDYDYKYIVMPMRI